MTPAMLALIQRVTEASVVVDGEIVGAIDAGLLAFVGMEPGDTDAQIARMAERLLGYRVFEHPVAQEAFGHAPDMGIGVARFHADEGEQAGVDRADGSAFDFDAGGGHALDQGKHGRCVAMGAGQANRPRPLDCTP